MRRSLHEVTRRQACGVGRAGHLGQHGLVHLVLAGGRAIVAAEDGVPAHGVAPGVTLVLEERALVPVLLQKLPALLWALGIHLQNP